MYTTVDCKSYLTKQLAARAQPWTTREADWEKTSQYKEGPHQVREFQHRTEGIVLSVRESNDGLSMDFDRSTASLSNLATSGSLGVDPNEFFVAVAPQQSSGSHHSSMLYVIQKDFFHQNLSLDDDNESTDICAQAWFTLFPDLSLRRGYDSFEVSGAPPSEIWRRLKTAGFLEYDPVTEKVGNSAVRSSDVPDEDFDSLNATEEKINRLAQIQLASAPPPLAPKPVTPTAAVVPPSPASATNPAMPPQRSGQAVARKVAPPPLRRFGQGTMVQHTASSQNEVEVSTLDLTPFTGDSWPPARPEDWPKAVEKLLLKKVLSAEDLKRLAQGFQKINNEQFIQISTMAMTLLQNGNPGVELEVLREKERRAALGEETEFKPLVVESFPLDFL